jgi:protein required for attachment to host cells
MQTRPPPNWILIANATRARVLEQSPGNRMVVLESFVHAGRGQRFESADGGRNEITRFAQVLAQFLEQEARLGHFGGLSIFACGSLLEELRASLGKVTAALLYGTHEMDLTSVGLAELEWRVPHEVALASH